MRRQTKQTLADLPKIRLCDERGEYLSIDVGDNRRLMIDDADYTSVSDYRWSISVSHGCLYYAIRPNSSGRPLTILMHRQLLNPPRKLTVDHDDNDGLNNRRYNLAVVPHWINMSRQPQKTTRGESGRRGVYRSGSRYMAVISIRGFLTYIGTFDDADDAARAWDKAAIERRGPKYTLLNCPGQP